MVVIVFRYRLDGGVLTDLLVVFHPRKRIGSQQALEVTSVKVAELIQPYGLFLSAPVTPEQLEEIAATVHHGEYLPAIKAFGSDCMSHTL